MVIVHLAGGLGNQMGQYAMGRSLAHKLNTKLKLDIAQTPILYGAQPKGHTHYRLHEFNIQENFATPEEIEHVKTKGITPSSISDLKNLHGDIFITGFWMLNPNLYNDIAPFIYNDFTLRKPLGEADQRWKEKILAAECSVSMHFRHGDYAYNPNRKNLLWAAVLPLDYYYTCIDILKQQYPNLTAFVFSNNLQWCRENLRLDIPTEYVSGGGYVRRRRTVPYEPLQT